MYRNKALAWEAVELCPLEAVGRGVPRATDGHTAVAIGHGLFSRIDQLAEKDEGLLSTVRSAELAFWETATIEDWIAWTPAEDPKTTPPCWEAAFTYLDAVVPAYIACCARMVVHTAELEEYIGACVPELVRRVFEYKLLFYGRSPYWTSARALRHFEQIARNRLAVSLADLRVQAWKAAPAWPAAWNDTRKSTGDRGEPAAVEDSGNIFRREQDFWAVSFNGKAIRMKHSRGLGYIAELLRVPGKEIEALAFTGRCGPEGPAVAATDTGLPLADATTLTQVRSELEKRKAELAQLAPNDWARKGDLGGEIAKLEAYLRDVQGLYGRSRRIVGASELARSAVSHSIARAIRGIGKAHQALAQHLRDSIRTGNTFLYLPSKSVEWRF